MKIIDAINKINKEEKFRFRLLCDGDIYKYIGGSLYNETVGERAEWIIDNKWLNEEIEILEEEPYVEVCGRWFTKSEYDKLAHSEEEKKIPEKLYETSNIGDLTITYPNNEQLMNKTNEIIDYLHYLKSKGK